MTKLMAIIEHVFSTSEKKLQRKKMTKLMAIIEHVFSTSEKKLQRKKKDKMNDHS